MGVSPKRNFRPSAAAVIVVHDGDGYDIRVCENGEERCARFDVERDAIVYACGERIRLGLDENPMFEQELLASLSS